jgi:PPOX class probable F420-dependent enzyme
MAVHLTRQECEQFLADVHLAIICVAEEEGRGPLAVPIWYAYEPGGDLWFTTGKDSRKAGRMAVTGRITLCVQKDRPPYKYVTVEGPVTGIEPVDMDRHIRVLARRYLGIEAGDRYVENPGYDPVAEEVVYHVRPEHWRSLDFSRES